MHCPHLTLVNISVDKAILLLQMEIHMKSLYCCNAPLDMYSLMVVWQEVPASEKGNALVLAQENKKTQNFLL